jgi:hypothetical protein
VVGDEFGADRDFEEARQRSSQQQAEHDHVVVAG